MVKLSLAEVNMSRRNVFKTVTFNDHISEFSILLNVIYFRIYCCNVRFICYFLNDKLCNFYYNEVLHYKPEKCASICESDACFKGLMCKI